jgi:hypothetical protein
LSRPDIRDKYDRERARIYLNKVDTVNGSKSINYHSDVPSYTAQKENYYNVTLNHASSNWRELRDKYKTEKWQNKPLSEKKMSRIRTITSGTSLAIISIPIIVLLIYSGYLHNQTIRPKKRYY